MLDPRADHRLFRHFIVHIFIITYARPAINTGFGVERSSINFSRSNNRFVYAAPCQPPQLHGMLMLLKI